MLKQERIDKVTLDDIARTYRGKVGCACGCLGKYYEIETAEHLPEIKKHLNYINSKLGDSNSGFFGDGAFAETPSGNHITKIFFKDSIRIFSRVHRDDDVTQKIWVYLYRVTEEENKQP